MFCLKTNYDTVFQKEVYTSAAEMRYDEYLRAMSSARGRSGAPLVSIAYSSRAEFVRAADYFGIMNDFKDGVPRTAYMGVVRVYVVDYAQTVYLVPEQKLAWTGYDTSWK